MIFDINSRQGAYQPWPPLLVNKNICSPLNFSLIISILKFGVTQIKSYPLGSLEMIYSFEAWEVWMAWEANNVDWHTCHQQLIACSLSATITHLSIGNWTKVYTRVLLETERFTLMKCEIPNYHLSFTQIKPIENRWLPLEVETFWHADWKTATIFNGLWNAEKITVWSIKKSLWRVFRR